MKRQRLRQLARNPDNIAGVNNYCDRWCERCAFTGRCLQYQMERDDPIPNDEMDLQNPAFFDRISETFKETAQMMREDAAKHGIDLNAASDAVDQAMERRERRRERASRRSPLQKLGMQYVKAVRDWFAKNDPLLKARRDELVSRVEMELPGTTIEGIETEAKQIIDACEIVRWYNMQITVKLHRAMMNQLSADDPDLSDPDDPHRFDDRDGSAKVALIGLDRSIEAWTRLRDRLADDTGGKDSVVDMLVTLSTIRKEAEKEFPQARAFVRAGFDEGSSPEPPGKAKKTSRKKR